MTEQNRQALWALSKLRAHGWEAYLVGGCVRDALRGTEPHDYDICTNALPQDIQESFAGHTVVETGIAHGTVTVVHHHVPLEITTYRVDGTYSDGRHPDAVCFTRSLTEDLRRRDFTINAMAMDEQGRIIDPFGGQEDLQRGLIRCVGEADQRFCEDALRILRALRFAAVLGFEIEPDTRRSLMAHIPLLSHIAAERIRQELDRIVVGPYGVGVLRRYREVFCYIIPELRPMLDHPQHNPYHRYDIWEHTLHAMEGGKSLLPVRLALLLHDIGKPQCFTIDEAGVGHFRGHPAVGAKIAAEILRRLRYDNETKHLVTALVERHDVLVTEQESLIRRRLRQYGPEFFELWLEVKRGDVCGQGVHQERLELLDRIEAVYRRIVEEGKCFCRKDLEVTGRDIMALGVPAGRQVGVLLERLLDAVVEDALPNEKKTLLAYAQQMMDKEENN